MGELSKMSTGCGIVGACRFLFVRESSQVDSFPVNSDSGTPKSLASVGVPTNSLVSTLAPNLRKSVFGVCGRYTNSQVFVTVIQRVAVDMVNRHQLVVENLHYHSAHVDDSPNTVFTDIGLGVKRAFSCVPKGVPTSLREFLPAVWAYLRKLSLRKRYQAVILSLGCHARTYLRVGFGGWSNTRQPDYIVGVK